MNTHKIPLSRAFIWILFSILLIPGSALMGWLYYLHARERRLHDDQYRIVAIVQQSMHGEGLQTAYLAELLNLTIDKPVNIYAFNIKEGEKTLEQLPIIKNVTIKKILPGTLYISYEMRRPIAYIGDYTNSAIDNEGYLFPCRPFFTPKKLPKIYLGIEHENKKWGDCLQKHPAFPLIFEIMQYFQSFEQYDIFLKQLDLSKIYVSNYGRREIIVIVEKSQMITTDITIPPLLFYLRLNNNQFLQSLNNFLTIYVENLRKSSPHLLQQNLHNPKYVIIDLRIPHLAFINQTVL